MPSSSDEPQPRLTHLVSEEDLPRALEEIAAAIKSEQGSPAGEGSTTDPQDETPASGGTKASRALVAAVTTLLVDNEVTERADQLAVASLLCDERIPMLADLRETEARYLLKRIPQLVDGGTFGSTIERARAAAAS
jgi:hypothetical protein